MAFSKKKQYERVQCPRSLGLCASRPMSRRNTQRAIDGDANSHLASFLVLGLSEYDLAPRSVAKCGSRAQIRRLPRVASACVLLCGGGSPRSSRPSGTTHQPHARRNSAILTHRDSPTYLSCNDHGPKRLTRFAQIRRMNNVPIFRVRARRPLAYLLRLDSNRI